MSKPRAGTARTFSDKWSRNPSLAFEQTVDENAEISRWILTRNGFGSGEGLAAYLADKDRILDAGCGNRRVTALLQRYAPEGSEIVGVDLHAAEVARENLARRAERVRPPGHLLERSTGGGRAAGTNANCW